MYLKDLFVFNTSWSPMRGNINKPSLEEVTCFDPSCFLEVSPELILLRTSPSVLRV